MTSLFGGVNWHGMEFSPGEGEPDTVTVNFDAPSAVDARHRAQQMLDEAQRLARAKPRGSTVVWVTPLNEGQESSLRFFGRAKELFESEEYDLAVVAAQIHLEVQVATLVRLCTRDDRSPLVGVLTGSDRGWAPHQRSGREVLEALLGRKMTEFSRWSAYSTHVKRRNDVVHGGSAVDAESARESLDVIYELWMWLNDGAQRRSDRGVLSPAALAAVSRQRRLDEVGPQETLPF